MGRISLSTRLTMMVGVLASCIVAIAAISIGMLVYVQSEHQIRNQLSSASTIIIKDYLMNEEGIVAHQAKDNGQSLVMYLRNMDMSVLLVNSSGLTIAEYGIYRNIKEADKKNLFDTIVLEAVKRKGSGIYTDKELPQVGRLDTFTVPLRNGSEIIGYMQLSRINNIWPIITQSLLWALLIQLPITWVAAVYMIRWGTYRTLSPLNELVSTVETLDIDRLPESIREPARMDHDVLLLYKTLRALISRIRSTLIRQREISLNVSHEFKTPLTRVITRLALIVHEVTPAHKTVINSVMKELVDLGQQVDGLLDVATNETSMAQFLSPSILLKPLIEELCTKLPRATHVAYHIPHDMKVPIPEGHARILWRNLLDNASKYGLAHGTIDIAAHETHNRWFVSVSNAADKTVIATPHVFLRHYRGFVSHSIQGYGLGMAIVRDICRQLKLDVNYNVEDNSRVIVQVSGEKKEVRSRSSFQRHVE